jgi:hypothetical protein
MSHVKTRLFETHHREYENFVKLSMESIDSMSLRFQTIVTEVHANKPQLPYNGHERALKLLHALDQRVCEIKVVAITESASYETLTVDELFSKLKSTEIDQQSRAKIENSSNPTMAQVSGSRSLTPQQLSLLCPL